jgi:hypothetical protein
MSRSVKQEREREIEGRRGGNNQNTQNNSRRDPLRLLVADFSKEEEA